MIIRITDLKIDAVLGVYPPERHTLRRVFVTAELEYDASAAAASDALDDALNYDDVCARISRLVREAQAGLIERLAALIVDELLKDARIQSVRVIVSKPGAVPNAANVSVEHEGWRGTYAPALAPAAGRAPARPAPRKGGKSA